VEPVRPVRAPEPTVCALRVLLLAMLAAAVVSTMAPGTARRAEASGINLHALASGLSQPLGIVSPRDGTGRLFIVERGGTVRIWTGASLLATPFLDISSLITTSGQEQGLLGLVFDPQYKTNGEFYVQYTATNDDLVVARMTVSGNPNVANTTLTPVLTQPHPTYVNHNGGELQFGPDGYLYVGFGDGGGTGDPNGNAQNVNTLLGKLLRIDVHAPTYTVPPTNPLVGQPGLDEIWAYGLRNPWRFTFDRTTGDLFIADVGQDSLEEIDVQPAGDATLRNYGWNVMEATACYAPPSGCDTSGKTFPVLQYDHSLGCSVTGGYRYRGSDPTLYGKYVYGDFCSGRIWTATQSGSTWSSTLALDTSLLISSFGEDDAGELYLAGFADGTLYRITDPQPPARVGGIAQRPDAIAPAAGGGHYARLGVMALAVCAALGALGAGAWRRRSG